MAKRKMGKVNIKWQPGMIPDDGVNRPHLRIIVDNIKRKVMVDDVVVEMPPGSIYQFELYQPEHLRCEKELREWTYEPTNFEDMRQQYLATLPKKKSKRRKEDDET